jgi:hypothetical protein
MTIIDILLVVLGLITVGALAILLAPFTGTAEFHVSSAGRRNGALQVRWLHPWIARWQYDIAEKCSAVTLLGITRISNGGTKTGRKTGRSPVPDIGNQINAPSFQEQKRETDTTPQHKPEQTTQVITQAYDNHHEAHSRNMSAGKKETDEYHSGIWQKVKSWLSILGDLRNRRAAVKILRWSGRTLHLFLCMVSFHRFRFHAKAGTGDPAETGKIYGYYTALESGCLSTIRNVDVRFSPEFSDDRFECDGSIAVRTSTARVLLPLLWSLLTFPYLRAYFVWRRIQKKNTRENPKACHA